MLLGVHLALLAMCIRKWTRIPYLLVLTLLYAAFLVPFWIPGPSYPFLPSLIATGTVLVLLIVPIAIRGREEMMEGTNCEVTVPAHLVLVLVYLLLPAIHAASVAGN